MKILLLLIIAVMFAAKSYAYPITAPEGKTLKVHWAVLEAKPGKMSEMAAISARTVAKYTPNEAGSYALYGAIDESNHDLMRLLEIYEDEAAYQVHRSSEGFRNFIEERKPILKRLVILPVEPIVLEQKAEGRGTVATMTLLEVKPEKLADFKALVASEMQRAVRDDDGVLGLFATAELEDRSNYIHTLEIFTDAEAREQYLASSEYHEYVKALDEMIISRKDFMNLPANIVLSKKGLH